MNKSLLILALLASGVCFGANAESEVYLFDYLGQIGGVADNGRYAAVSDYDNGIAYLWDSEHPDDLIDITEITEDADRLPSSQVAASCSRMAISIPHTIRMGSGSCSLLMPGRSTPTRLSA